MADIRSIGFELNPYDPCVSNKMVDGHQLTICWHVDDLFIGHKNPQTVTNILHWLQQRYEIPDKPLKATRGAHHDYSGINIKFLPPQ